MKWRLVACLVWGFVVAGCGGGGGGSAGGEGANPPTAGNPPTPPSLPPDPGAIPGTAVDFPARVNDIEWSERHRLLYLAMAASNGAAGNSIVAVDPLTNQVVHSRAGCSEPAEMALSDDNHYLHVACNGSSSLQRYRLPELALDQDFFLPRDSRLGLPYAVNDIVAVPGQPKSVVAALYLLGDLLQSPSITRVYDDGVPRPVELGVVTGGDCWSLAWAPSRTRLLCARTSNTGFGLLEAALTSTGLTAERRLDGVFRQFYARMAVDPVTGVLHGTDGTVFDTTAWQARTRLEVLGPIALDPVLERLYIASSSDRALSSFNSRTLAAAGYSRLGAAQPQRLIRWGATGLALTTAGNSTLILGGNGQASINTAIARSTATQRNVPIRVRKLVQDPVRGLLYGTGAASATEPAQSVIVIDPDSARVIRTQAMGSTLNALAVSADGQYLYVGDDGAGRVRRLRLPGLEEDAAISLGQAPEAAVPYTAGVIRVSPTNPRTIAVTRVRLDRIPNEVGGVVVFDGTVPRPLIAGFQPDGIGSVWQYDIVWNADSTGLYSVDIMSNLRALSVSAAGVNVEASLGAFPATRSALHLNRANQFLFMNGGSALNLVTGRPAGYIGGQNLAVDEARALVFTLTPGLLQTQITVHDANRLVPQKIYDVTGSDVSIAYDFMQLRPGLLAYASTDGVHIVQLAP